MVKKISQVPFLHPVYTAQQYKIVVQSFLTIVLHIRRHKIAWALFDYLLFVFIYLLNYSPTVIHPLFLYVDNVFIPSVYPIIFCNLDCLKGSQTVT